jgi:hypothetical protein
MAEHRSAMVLFRHVSVRERWEASRPARARALALAAVCVLAVAVLIA